MVVVLDLSTGFPANLPSTAKLVVGDIGDEALLACTIDTEHKMCVRTRNSPDAGGRGFLPLLFARKGRPPQPYWVERCSAEPHREHNRAYYIKNQLPHFIYK